MIIFTLGAAMPVRRLSASPALNIERFGTAEEYCSHEVIGGGVSAPLDPCNSSATRAILAFPDSLLVLQRSFPRRLDANMGPEYGLGVVVPISFTATINGRVFDNATIALMRSKTPTTAIEEQPNTYLTLRFNSDMRSRCWAEDHTGIAAVTAAPDRVERLGAVILEMFQFASNATDLDEAQDSMRETLVAALDSILLVEGTRCEQARSSGRYRRLVDGLDELVRFDTACQLYVDPLASQLGASIRTLNTAVRAVHGISPYRYLLGKRLWSARKQLMAGHPTATIKHIAMGHGFWHMGEFSRTYKTQFGELPSETLRRARGLR